MKTLLTILFTALTLFWAGAAQEAQIRVFFFNRAADGSAQFRLRCVGNPPANRCTEAEFSKKGGSLCKEASLVLKGIQPFGCIIDVDTKVRSCRFSNGTCSTSETSKPVKERPPLNEENPTLPPLPTVEQLPEASQLPEIPERPAEVRPLPDAQSLPAVEPSQDLPSPQEVSPLPERDTSLPQVQSLPEAQ